MFGTPKPTASLSSSLLARKGHARPAMRPQGFVGLSPATTQDDLGWNDMGDETPAAAEPVAKPTVLREREALDERLAATQPAPEPVPAPAPAISPAVTTSLAPAAAERLARTVASKKTKAAFTLRLDHDRHLRLRLASAVTNRSAQQIVTAALDAYLETLTEVEALARQVDPARNRG